MNKVNLNKTDLSSIVIDGEAELIFTEELSKDAGRKFVLWGIPVLLCGFSAGWYGFMAVGVALFVLYLLAGLYVVQTRCVRRFSKLFLAFVVPAFLTLPVPFINNPPAYILFPAWAVFMVCFITVLKINSQGGVYEH